MEAQESNKAGIAVLVAILLLNAIAALICTLISTTAGLIHASWLIISAVTMHSVDPHTVTNSWLRMLYILQNLPIIAPGMLYKYCINGRKRRAK